MVIQLLQPAHVGPKGQVVIPKPARDALGIKPNEDVLFRLEDGRLTIEPTSRRKAVDEFINGVPNKTKEPRSINWRKVWDEKYEERLRRWIT